MCPACKRTFDKVLKTPAEPPNADDFQASDFGQIDKLFASFEAAAAADRAAVRTAEPPVAVPLLHLQHGASAPETTRTPVMVMDEVEVEVEEEVDEEVEEEQEEVFATLPEVTSSPAPAAAAAPPTAAMRPDGAVETASAVATGPSRKQRRSLLPIAAGIVIVAAAGIPLSRMVLGRQQQIVSTAKPAARPTSPAPASRKAAAQTAPSARPTVAAPIAPKAPPASKAAIATPVTSNRAAVQQAVARPAAPAVAPRPAASPEALVANRKPSGPSGPMTPRPSTTPPAAIAARIPVAAAPVEISLPAEPVAELPEPAESPAQLAGPFYETQQVDAPPQVVTRVAPLLPENLRDSPRKDIVIVRVLVSQVGHPSLVSLLRRSKGGLAMDDEVINAVRRWTFTPARKRGEPVSCYMHIGVPITGGE